MESSKTNLKEKCVIFCKICKTFTNQLLKEENEDLVVVGSDSLSQDYECEDCFGINRQILHKCFRCNCFRIQVLVSEKKNELMAKTIDQKFRCIICNDINTISKDSDDEISRFLNEEGN